MKTETFVELLVDTYHHGRGNWGELTLVNMSEVLKIERDRNWSRVFLKNGTSFLCNEAYEQTLARIKGVSWQT